GCAGRLDLEVMAAPRLDADHLATAGDTDPLLGCLMALDLGHPGLTLLSRPVPAAPAIRSSWSTPRGRPLRPLPWPSPARRASRSALPWVPPAWLLRPGAPGPAAAPPGP